MKKSLFKGPSWPLILLFFLFILQSQGISQKTISAKLISEQIKIDASFDEPAWQTQLDIAKDFISVRPVPNTKPDFPTEVKVLYDDDALYISAVMGESSRDSVSSQLMLRDQIGNTDFFGVIIDTYGNGNSAFEFILSCTGVQFDAKVTPQNEDSSWDAVWYGAAQINDDGWVAELKIPYSSIRFPSQDEQEWKINFFRQRQVKGEQHCWSNVDFEMDNPWLTQLGTLKGIKNIKPPIRLQLSPYASAYGVNVSDPNTDPSSSTATSYNMGMDVKYGINDAFTVDMTLIPDFGQVQSDNQILNLTPFEVRFNENRPFFTEGTEIFNKAGIFYSRRVGDNQQLYNATKLSGRTEKGLGIGVFNAIAGEEAHMIPAENLGDAEVKQVSQPLTNFNIVVFDQDLKNNSSFSLTNTNVWRRGESFHNANVTAATFNLKNKKQTYGINGKFALSQLINSNSENQVGMDNRISIEKLSGSLIGGINYQEVGENYNHNDLGFFYFGNYREASFWLVNRDVDGFGPFNRFNYWLYGNYERNKVPDVFVNARLNPGFFFETKSFFRFNAWAVIETKRNNFFEPRVAGRHFERPASNGGGIWMGTDQRKKLNLQFWANYFSLGKEYNWKNDVLGTQVRYRFSDQLSLSMSSELRNDNNSLGYVNQANNEIQFGRRDVRTVSNNMYLSYTFSSTIGATFNMRHYWSKLNYHEFYDLEKNGSLAKSNYTGFHDLSFTAFTIDAVFSWQFAPGSQLSFVWKNNISGVHIDEGINYNELGYRDGINRLKDLPQTNSLSLRVTYFLDWNDNLKPIFKK